MIHTTMLPCPLTKRDSCGFLSVAAEKSGPDFYAFWADGNADQLSESKLYFTNHNGDKVWVMPYDMKGDFATPERIK